MVGTKPSRCRPARTSVQAARNSATLRQILLKRDAFHAGTLYTVMMGDQSQHVRLEELLEREEDYDRVRVSWLKGAR